MRYTTIIDISQDAALYRNKNARLIYLHLVLIAGYHDDDRDQARISIRRLAADSGLTISATRHALKILQTRELVKFSPGHVDVKKFILDKKITARAKTEEEAREKENRRREKEIKDEERKRRDDQAKKYHEQRAAGINPYLAHMEELKKKAAAGDEEAAASLKLYNKNI